MRLSIYKTILIFVLPFIFASFTFAQTERETGIELYKKGDYKGAIKLLKQATKIDSDDANAWYYLGFSYLKTDKLKEAEKALKTVIKLKPDDSQGYMGVAYLQLSANKIYEAQAAAQKALELNEQNPEAHYIVGLINFRNGSFNGAYERAEKAIKIDPNFADAYLLKSEALTFSYGIIRGTVTKSPTREVELLKESVVNMEKYLSLSTYSEDKKFQQERLESLKFFAAHYEKPENQIPNNLGTASAAAANSTPIKITSKPHPGYTTSAREARTSGIIRLLVGFSENGKVKYILVLRGLANGLNEQAVKAAQGIEFEPATKDGKPISVVKQIEYSFLIYFFK
jgi:TonB family protein